MSETAEKKRPRGKSQQERREQVRDMLWPDAADRIWRSKGSSGFVPLPRILPLVADLVRAIGGKGDPSRVYLDLWFRCFDDGYVVVDSVDVLAASAGYSGTRATRTWREHMLQLAELGLVEYEGNQANEFRHVLLIDPARAVADLYEREPKRFPDGWWANFVERLAAIGAELPKPPRDKSAVARIKRKPK